MTAGSQEQPHGSAGWMALIDPRLSDWRWIDQRLHHEQAIIQPLPAFRMSFMRRLVLEHIYANHNASRRVKRALTQLLDALGPADWALNLGAGNTRVHPRAINLDLYDTDNIDIVTRGHELPFLSGSLALVMSQEVLEHLADPVATVSEVRRVLRPGGVFYCQVPFIIGYHPGPYDFWRFTREGVAKLFDPALWEIREITTSVGHGSGFYRIAVEFVAVTASAVHRALYLPVKALAAILLWPLKVADLLTPFVSEADRIPGGYFCIAVKRG